MTISSFHGYVTQTLPNLSTTVENLKLFDLQALEVSRLMAMMKPDETEEVLLASCQKLSSIFQEFPMQKKDLMMPHGIIPLMDMLDVNSNKV